MRFQKGVHYPHPPRGRARRPYDVTDAARRARRQNLSTSRLRSDWETSVIKRLVWQERFDGGQHSSQRTLARQLGVQPSYVCRVQKQTAAGLEALTTGPRATLDELADARRFTAKLRTHEQGLLRTVECSPAKKPRPTTEDEIVVRQPPASVAAGIEGHCWNCRCNACRAARLIEAAIRNAKAEQQG